MADLASVKAVVYGHVQGVFFRAFVSRQATGLGLTGYVCNLPGGNAVEVRAEGGKEQLDKLIGHLKTGPPAAQVTKVEIKWAVYTGDYSRFSIKY